MLNRPPCLHTYGVFNTILGARMATGVLREHMECAQGVLSPTTTIIPKSSLIGHETTVCTHVVIMFSQC